MFPRIIMRHYSNEIELSTENMKSDILKPMVLAESLAKWPSVREEINWCLYEGNPRIIVPPVDGTCGSSWIRSISSPTHDWHGRPEHCIEPCSHNQQCIWVCRHLLACKHTSMQKIQFSQVNILKKKKSFFNNSWICSCPIGTQVCSYLYQVCRC